MSRYIVVAGSQSAHCCFDFTVVDTGRPLKVEDESEGFESMCECFERQEADKIAVALNRVDAECESEGVTLEFGKGAA